MSPSITTLFTILLRVAELPFGMESGCAEVAEFMHGAGVLLLFC